MRCGGSADPPGAGGVRRSDDGWPRMSPGPGVLIPLVFGAGLATGRLRFWIPACVVALLWAVGVRSPPARLFAAVLALGALTGAATRALDARSCAARMREGRVEALIHSRDAASGRGLVRLRLVGAGCLGPVDARWPNGARVAAGVTGRVS